LTASGGFMNFNSFDTLVLSSTLAGSSQFSQPCIHPRRPMRLITNASFL
jgi:hypothetical protein